jgi:hypothetical protein
MITVQPIPDTRLVTELGGDIAVVRVPDGPVLAYLTTFEVEQDGTFVRGWSGCWPRAGETISSPYLAPTFDEMVSHVVFLLKQIRPEVVGVTPYEAGDTLWVSQGSRTHWTRPGGPRTPTPSGSREVASRRGYTRGPRVKVPRGPRHCFGHGDGQAVVPPGSSLSAALEPPPRRPGVVARPAA